jgi:hypothetical protein
VNIKLLKRFISRSSPQTIAAILNVPVAKVYDWENKRSFPDKDQVKEIKKLNSPWRRLKRALARKTSLFLKDSFLSLSKGVIYPYSQDRGLITHNLATFRKDPKFLDAYAKGTELHDNDPKSYYRIHQAIWATSVAIENEGDWVELGTGRGFIMSAALRFHREKWNQSSKSLWLVDTFSPYVIDGNTGTQLEGSEKMEYYCKDLDQLKEHFKEFNNVQFLQGLVPECLDRLKIEKISFLHIDLNSAKPEIEGLSVLWSRLVKGGILLLDDYGVPGRKDQHDAMNDFAASHSFEIFQMATGQGLVIK